MVGAIYLDGVLTERDQKEGRRWLQRAANQGLTAAQELLEHC
jgi:TPR repeat protein